MVREEERKGRYGYLRIALVWSTPSPCAPSLSVSLCRPNCFHRLCKRWNISRSMDSVEGGVETTFSTGNQVSRREPSSRPHRERGGTWSHMQCRLMSANRLSCSSMELAVTVESAVCIRLTMCSELTWI